MLVFRVFTVEFIVESFVKSFQALCSKWNRILIPFILLATFAHAQSPTYMGLSGIELTIRPELRFSNNNIYLETWDGLYSKSLSSTGSSWTLVTENGTTVLGYLIKGDSLLVTTPNGMGNCMLMSSNGGTAWRNHTNGLGGSVPADFLDPTEMAAHPTNAETLFALSGNCVAKSTNFGKSWTPIKKRLGLDQLSAAHYEGPSS